MTRPSLPPHLSEDALVLHYYGETEAVDRPHVEAHLAACEPCRDALERLDGHDPRSAASVNSDWFRTRPGDPGR